MKTLLIIEDNLYTAEFMSDNIQAHFANLCELNIKMCNGLFEADEILEQEPKIDLIIADLNMSPDGLDSAELIAKTKGAVLTGWVWAKNRIIDRGYQIPICFYTAFSEELESNDDYNNMEDKSLITIVSKGEAAIQDLYEMIELLFNLNK